MTAHPSPAEIEGEIRHTRAEMDSTIHALESKLSPGELLDRTLSFVKEGGAEMGRNLAERVRENPLPIAVMAGGLGWLIATEVRGRRKERDEFGSYGGLYAEDYDEELDHEAHNLFEGVQDAVARVKHGAEETADVFADRLYDAKAGALGLTKDAAEGASAFRARVDEAYEDLSARAKKTRAGLARRAKGAWRRTRSGAKGAGRAMSHGAQDATANIKHGVEDAAAAIKHGAEDVTRRSRQMFEDSPIAAGVAGLAAGALLGALVPTSRRENQLFGRTGDELRRGAREATKDALGAAGDAARREGLSPQGVRAGARELADRTRRVGEEAIAEGREDVQQRMRGEGSS